MNLDDYRDTPCGCESGLSSRIVNDARGIYLCRVCDECEERQLSGYRPEVIANPNYWHDEPVEDEDESYDTSTW
jgi:hypothetical protein